MWGNSKQYTGRDCWIQSEPNKDCVLSRMKISKKKKLVRATRSTRSPEVLQVGQITNLSLLKL